MRLKRRKRSGAATWMVAAGVVVTGAVAAYAVSRILKAGPIARRREMWALEKRVLQALLSDATARGEGVDIAGVGAGIVELSGLVDNENVARHIVGRVTDVAGVHGVVNRLHIRSQETALQRNRASNRDEPVRWYGGGVGMGRRRQSAQTDPLRRDDHATMVARSLEADLDDALPEREPGAPPEIAPHDMAQID